MRLFSYVVDHDYGFAPNPDGGLCTLAKCKFGTKRRNITELADPGDWVIGTGGASADSAGHGKLVYAMRVDQIIPLAIYCTDERFMGRVDSELDIDCTGRFALLSRHFFYFGRNAIDIADIPKRHLDHPLEKKGPRYRSDFSEPFIEELAAWLERTFETGIHGLPCRVTDDRFDATDEISTTRKRKRC